MKRRDLKFAMRFAAPPSVTAERVMETVMTSNVFFVIVSREQGRKQGHWAMPLSLGAPLRLFGALQSQMCLQGKCSWRAPSGALQRRKVPPKSPSMCLQRKFSWRAPSGTLRRPRTTKCPSETSLQWRPTVWRPPWVKWRSPNPCPPPFAIL